MTEPSLMPESTPESTPTPDKDGKLSAQDLEGLLQRLDKRLADKDEFIERLKTENAGMRAEVQSQARLQEMLDKLTKEPVSTPSQPATEEKGFSPDDIAKIVDEQVTKRAKEARRNTNINEVSVAIKDGFGENANQKLKDRMANLGIGEEFLKSVAAESPKAAIELLSMPKKAPEPDLLPFAPPRSQINPETFKPTSGEKTWKDYEVMRRSTDPKIRAQYWTPAVQNELHKRNIEYAERGLDFTKS